MKRKHQCSRLLAGLLAMMACAACHAEFAAPAEGPVAFRRDRVPLDAETMSGLSKNLTTLARTQPMASPAERRSVAQQLALAQALDPGNAAGRELMAACRDGGHTPLKDAAGRDLSLEKIRQLATWLKLPEAGTNGQALAACLEDILAATNPGQAAAVRETGAWAGWVPELASYEPRPSEPVAETDNSPSSTESELPIIRLQQAALGSLAWKQKGENESATWTLAPTSLKMTCSLADDPSAELSIQIGPQAGPLEKTARMIRALLENHHGEPPAGLKIFINCREFSSSPEADTALPGSAAAAVLASAAITGRQPDAIVLGVVDENGALTLPWTFWNQLLALGPGNGKRLVLPAKAAAMLPSLLATGNPGFFMDYEVLLARDFPHLLELTAKEPPQAVAAASAKFHAIRGRMAAEDVRAYVANRFVRPRLGELAQEAPHHASAALLFTQASGQRPTVIARTALTAELLRACEALSWVSKTEGRDLDVSEIDQLEKMHDAFRKRLDELAGLAAKADQDLIASTRELIQALREIERATRGRGEHTVRIAEIWRARNNFIQLFKEVETSLTEEARKLAKQ